MSRFTFLKDFSGEITEDRLEGNKAHVNANGSFR